MHALRFEIHFAPQRLQTFLQQKHPHEILRRLATDQRRHRARLLAQHAAAVSTVLRPQIDQGIRRGIMIGLGFLRDLAPQDTGQHRPHEGAIGQSLQTSRLVRWRFLKNQILGGAFELARRHGMIDQAESLRLATIDCATAEHQVHRRRCTDQRRQTYRAAEAGMDA